MPFQSDKHPVDKQFIFILSESFPFQSQILETLRVSSCYT